MVVEWSQEDKTHVFLPPDHIAMETLHMEQKSISQHFDIRTQKYSGVTTALWHERSWL